MTSLDLFQGCLLGLSLGDALGAPYEGGVLERLLWRLIGKTSQGEMRWTDDTQMTIDKIKLMTFEELVRLVLELQKENENLKAELARSKKVRPSQR